MIGCLWRLGCGMMSCFFFLFGDWGEMSCVVVWIVGKKEWREGEG